MGNKATAAMTAMADQGLDKLLPALQWAGIRRFYFAADSSTDPTTDAGGGVVASHLELGGIADLIAADKRDFDGHEGIFCEHDPDTGVLMTATVHRTCRGQGAGGVRLWRYDRLRDLLVDGLRLSRGMTRKNALAGLWWGGGKGVVGYPQGVDVRDPERRAAIYRAYGRFVTSLRGCYVTAEDVGTSVSDMAQIFTTTRFTTCIPAELGGSGNPSAPTARGVVKGMQAALAHLGMGDLSGKTVAVQGLGHVAMPMIAELRELGVGRVIGSDIDADTVKAAADAFGPWLDARLVQRGDNAILGEAVDIVSPCAVGAALDPATIPTIRAAIVCGAANNQLADPLTDDARLQAAGVLYMPDFLVNRMGIVNCADEQYGTVGLEGDDDVLFERHLGDDWAGGILQLSRSILAEAAERGLTPAAVARERADAASLVPHPIHGHRGKAIVASLVRSRWADGAST